jgi:superfamily I DNA/RNA helicase
MGWLIPRDELTPDQIRAVELRTNEHNVILGAPGSGKTQILLHRARYLSDELGVAPERFHIFVFTNVLKKYIQSALVELGFPDECVTTLDDWCAQIYKHEIRPSLPWDAEHRCPDYATVRRAVSVRVQGRRPYDFVLVDEGQDLDPDAFALIKGLAPHVTVAMDHKQQIYEQGSGEAEIIRALGLRRGNLTLLDAFRCCPYIVRVAAEFIEGAAEREAFLNQSRTAQTEIQTPLLYEAADFDDERARLIEVLRERQLVDRSIAILFTKNNLVEGFAKGLREEGIPVETRKSGLDFSNAVPKILTMYSAKGLTFESVLMPRLVRKSFPGTMAKWANRLLYVGVTRATKWLYLSGTRGSTIAELDRVRLLADETPPVITVQRERPAEAEPARAGRSDDEIFDIF